MTAHELAHKLLKGPDLTVFVQDGLDPSDWVEVEQAYLSDDNVHGPGPCIELS